MRRSRRSLRNRNWPRRRRRGALQFARQSAVVLTDFWIANLQMAQVYEQQGEDGLALEALGRGGFGGENSKVLSMRGYILAKTGRENEAREVLKTLEAMARERYIPPYAIAQRYTGLRENDQAFALLERGIEEHDVHLAMLPTEPKWDALRGDRRFVEVLRKCGLPYGSSAC